MVHIVLLLLDISVRCGGGCGAGAKCGSCGSCGGQGPNAAAPVLARKQRGDNESDQVQLQIALGGNGIYVSVGRCGSDWLAFGKNLCLVCDCHKSFYEAIKTS